MIYVFCGFCFGFFIPYMSRRLAKSMPSAPTYALYNLIKPVKTSTKARLSLKFKRLKKKYLLRSILFAIISATLSWAILYKFGLHGIWWYLTFVWALLLLAEIDFKTFILPDIITIPLLLIGFAFAAFSQIGISPQESALAALVGYLLPLLSSLLMMWKSTEAFGFGDIKLLATIGAWLGVENVIYVILVSCVVFAIESVLRRQKVGAFGPSLAIASILVLFFK